MTVLRMDAFFEIEVGMRVRYDPPSRGESLRADKFFSKYGGKTGTIAGLATEYVGPLDHFGRMPGTYCSPKGIDVQFDGEDEVHEGINILHFILLDSAPVVIPEEPLRNQRMGDLPNPLRFYPDDLVKKIDDPLQTEHLVEDVHIKSDGEVIYTLAETAEDHRSRKEQEGPYRLMPEFPRTENCTHKQLELCLGGNVRWLYTDSSRMSFDTTEEELLFWSRGGLSKNVEWRYSLEEAQKLLEDGAGDLIIQTTKMYAKEEEYQVYRVLPCFQEHRERVRSLALGLDEPPKKPEYDYQAFREARKALANS